MKKYSVIVPVYNRPKELEELLDSLSKQSYTNFEVIIIEDGSSEPAESVVQAYSDRLELHYFFKENSGPGDSRNVGMEKAKGAYLLFFDSDCLIPPQYFDAVEKHLAERPLDAFGGPDSADPSFSNVQKAINFAMTSGLTTGGVRGKENALDNYQPRSFNMGISRAVYEKVGGYGDIHPGEDPDLSYRIREAGFSVGLIPGAFVYHKRRIDFKKFAKQVYKFGVVRPILIKWYPQYFKPTYFLPSIFLLGTIGLLVLGIFYSTLFLLPLGILALILFSSALFNTGHIGIAIMAVFASFLQLFSYGYGFLKSAIQILLLKRAERKVFPDFFFKEG